MSAHPKIEGKTVFVTGGTGFVGSHLVERLLELDCEVRCLVRQDKKWLSGLSVKFVTGTLQNETALKNGIDGAHFVFHIAGRTRGRHRDEFTLDNVTGTENLLRVAQESSSLERILITSTLAAVGYSKSHIADETTPLNPVSEYGRSKAHMEAMIKGYQDELPMTIVRPPAVYGPRETDILTFFQTLAKGLCPIVGSADKAALSLVHVDDLVNGCLLAAAHPAAKGKIFFIGGANQYSWGEIRDVSIRALSRRVFTIIIPKAVLPTVGLVSEWIGRLFGVYPPLNREKAREIGKATLMCDSSLAMRLIGYEPKTPLNKGIPATLKWYRDNDWL